MSKIREILLARRAEIESQIAPLQDELKEIAVALAAMTGGGAPTGEPSIPPVRHRERLTKTVPQQIVAVIADAPEGMANADVVFAMGSRFKRQLSTATTSWYLSNLKKDGRLKLEGDRWKVI